MEYFEYYLLGINAAGFLLYWINTILRKKETGFSLDKLLIVLSIIGGALGMLVALLIFDRKAEKANMTIRVFILCMLVIDIIVFLFIRGHHSGKINFAFWTFFAKHRFLMIYLGIINFVTFAAFAVDKINAIEKRGRVRIVSLLGLSFIGGSIGGLIAMYLLHHKTRKDYFTIGMPLIIVMQIFVLFYAMNAGW